MNMNRGNNPFYNAVMLGSRFVLNAPIHGFLLRLWGMQGVHSGNMQRLMN
jgi:hypothetical protein